ncbi:MAG: type VI secretion system lipoprotein TssJ [Leptothrix sp. (in: b-proteobacteria)]
MTPSQRCLEGVDRLERRRLGLLLGLLLAGAGSGCGLLGGKSDPAAGSAPSPLSGLFSSGPPELTAMLEASAKVNPDSRQRPSPLLLRLYELKAAAAFNNADFVSLYQRDQAELGGDLLAREEYLLSPGEKRPIKRQLTAQTRFLGVFAAYRDLERARWRLLVPVETKGKLQITIRADELALTLVPAA